MILKGLLFILILVVLLFILYYLLPLMIMRPIARLMPQSTLAINLRLYYTATMVSRCALSGYTRAGHLLAKDSFGRFRICVPNAEILVSPEDRLIEEVLNDLAIDLAPQLGFVSGRAHISDQETVFLFSTTDSIF